MAKKVTMINALSDRQRLSLTESRMRLERETWRNSWGDLSDFILVRRSRFFLTDANRGERKDSKVLDSTATTAARTLESGMMTGITSPARPWFKLKISDTKLNKSQAVKEYLKEVESLMRGSFLKSNLYNVLPTFYGDLGTFGTAAMLMEEDDEDIFRFTSLLIGSYMIANDKKGRARTFFREFRMTVRQIVDKFGRNKLNPQEVDWSNISLAVKNLYENNEMETWIDVNHMVEPNKNFKPGRLEPQFKKFASLYYERGVSSTNQQTLSDSFSKDKFLRKSGFDFFPVLVGRWGVAGEDVYGSGCPGMISIGDVKQLQLGEERILNAIDQKVKPSMVGPTALRNAKASILPGDITYLDENASFRRLFEVDFDIREMENKQQQTRQRVQKNYYEDLFLMLASSDRRQITATEVAERKEEKLLALGPVLQGVNQDVLDPLVDNSFVLMDKAGELPELPEELVGVDYEIEYISIMAQAQKLAGIGGIERLLGFVGQVSALDPSVAQKINYDETVEIYADLLGAPPSIVKSEEEMDTIREENAAAQAAAQAQEQLVSAVDAGKTLSETKVTDDSALTQLAGEGDIEQLG